MKAKGLSSESGLTLLEVLIAAVIFMIGFSLLMALLNSTLLKFSTKELITASAIGKEAMLQAISTADTTSSSSTVQESGIRYRVEKAIIVSDRLAGVTITVFRQKHDKKIIQLYDEFLVPGR